MFKHMQQFHQLVPKIQIQVLFVLVFSRTSIIRSSANSGFLKKNLINDQIIQSIHLNNAHSFQKSFR